MTDPQSPAPTSRIGRLGVSLVGLIPDVAMLVGAAFIYVGINDVYPPAAKIALGLLVLFAGWRLAR